MTATPRDLADLFEDSFRALKPHKLSAAILDLCREMAEADRKEPAPSNNADEQAA